MFQSPNPHRDAEAHEDMLEAQDGAHEFVCGRIRQALTVDITHTENLNNIALPSVAFFGINTQDTAPDIITDALGDDEKTLKALFTTMQKSTCPYVAELREAVAQFHIKRMAHKLNTADF